MPAARHLALLGLLAVGAAAGTATLAADAPIPRDRLVGDVEIPAWQEDLRLCANGSYVHTLACGGIVRGAWSVERSGLVLTAKEVCLAEGVPATKVGAEGVCPRFKEYRLVGCFAPEDGVARAERQGIPEVRVVPEIAAAELEAMLAGQAPPGGHGEKPWRLLHTPEPKACDPAYRPRTAEDLHVPRLSPKLK